MTEVDADLLKSAVESQIGRTRSWHFYERRLPTFMNLVLTHAERRAGRQVMMVWVDGGFPELFTLEGSTAMPVFSTRFIEISAFMRKILTIGSFDSAIRREQAGLTALRIMGEMALRLGHANLAVRCLSRSMVGRQIWIPDARYDNDELPPYNESYTAHWYYGILHEIGHSVPSPDSSIVSDAFMRVAVEEETVGPESLHPSLQPAQLRSEVVADMFAASLLLETTIMVMESAGEEFDPLAFIRECLISVAVIEIVERCRRQVSAPGVLGSAALRIRSGYMRRQLITDLHALTSPDGPSAAIWEGALIEIRDAFITPVLRDIEPGLSWAMRLANGTSPSTEEIFAVLHGQATGPDASFGQSTELAKLYDVVHASSASSPLLDDFTRLVETCRDSVHLGR